MDKFIGLIHRILKKDIEIEIDFQDIKSFLILNDIMMNMFNYFIC